jgi:hypothetical protein
LVLLKNGQPVLSSIFLIVDGVNSFINFTTMKIFFIGTIYILLNKLSNVKKTISG